MLKSVPSISIPSKTSKSPTGTRLSTQQRRMTCKLLSAVWNPMVKTPTYTLFFFWAGTRKPKKRINMTLQKSFPPCENVPLSRLHSSPSFLISNYSLPRECAIMVLIFPLLLNMASSSLEPKASESLVVMIVMMMTSTKPTKPLLQQVIQQ